jgi:protein-tyrosine phosphatase
MANQIMEYTYITDQILVGSSSCDESNQNMQCSELKNLGVMADIDLRAEYRDLPEGVTAHLWLPVVDTRAPTLEQTKVGIEFMNSVIVMGKKVYVHCQQGQGRSPALVAAYLIIKEGKTFADAEKLLQSKRPQVNFSQKQQEYLIQVENAAYNF